MENLNYKNKKLERKHLKNVQKNQFSNVKNSLLEGEKDFIELKGRELKNREVKIKREVEELFFKPVMMSPGDIDKFEKKEIKKIKPVKHT